jgi:hypothetical protein
MKAVIATDVNRAAVNCRLVAREVLGIVVRHEAIAEFVVDDSFVLHCTVSILKKPLRLSRYGVEPHRTSPWCSLSDPLYCSHGSNEP